MRAHLHYIITIWISISIATFPLVKSVVIITWLTIIFISSHCHMIKDFFAGFPFMGEMLEREPSDYYTVEVSLLNNSLWGNYDIKLGYHQSIAVNVMDTHGLPQPKFAQDAVKAVLADLNIPISSIHGCTVATDLNWVWLIINFDSTGLPFAESTLNQ